MTCFCVYQELVFYSPISPIFAPPRPSSPPPSPSPSTLFKSTLSTFLNALFLYFHNIILNISRLFITALATLPPTLQQKSHLCIPFLEIARPQPQFPHSCVCERFILTQERSSYFLQQNRQTDRGNI
jgi:hypothetical protein